MNVYSAHAEGLAQLQAELGADCPSLVINGKTVKILPGGARHKKDNGAGGFSLDSDIQLTCLSADFAAAPVSRQTFTYRGRTYRIESVTTAAGGLQIRIDANDASQAL